MRTHRPTGRRLVSGAMKTLRPPRIPEEHEQAALFRWFSLTRWKGRALSDLALHIPNEGKRSAVAGYRLKRVGMKPGTPDVLLPIAAGGYHGLWIEMKAIGGRLTEAQQEVIAMLRGQGYKVEVCFGWDAARLAVERYLGGTAPLQERA
jgi:hypothetical protein